MDFVDYYKILGIEKTATPKSPAVLEPNLKIDNFAKKMDNLFKVRFSQWKIYSFPKFGQGYSLEFQLVHLDTV